MKFVAASLAALGVAATLTTAAVAQTTPVTELNFGIISTESQSNLKTIWDPFLAAMSKQTGLKINAFFASDYAGVVEGMKFNKVDAAWFGNKSAMEAVDRSGGEVFAQSVAADGSPGYWSQLLVPADSPINSVDDILKCDKSLNFGIGDPNSTSGYLVPMTFIFAAKGINPTTCFKTVRAANHETNAMAVATKQVDVATNNTENMQRLAITNPEAAKKIKVIWTSPLIPSDPIVWRKNLDAATKNKVMTFFMTYGRQGTPDEVAQAREVLKGLQWAPFRPSSDAQLYAVRIMEIVKSIGQTEADAKLSPEQKTAALKDLNAQKEQFEALMKRVPQI